MVNAAALKSRQSIFLDAPPSCLQFCRQYPSFFVVGTYHLQQDVTSVSSETLAKENDSNADKKAQSRDGSLLVFRIGDDPLRELNLIQTVSQPSALLDIRFNDEVHRFRDMLAAVSSTGSLAIFKLDPGNATAPLQHLATSRCDDLGTDVLFLQCKWHPLLSHVLAVTTSTGEARLLFLDSQWHMSHHVDLSVANSLEAWSIAISPSSLVEAGTTNFDYTVYCGGDDSMLRYTSCSWNLGDAASSTDEHYPPVTIKGKHDAGVTAILPLDFKDENGGRVVITGSYDEHIRVFVIDDLHESFGARRVEKVVEERLGGGVWRLGLMGVRTRDYGRQILLLASCMHGGARVIDLRTKKKKKMGTEREWSLEVLAGFEEHQSMNYASDFMPTEWTESKRVICVSSSFYDRLLCVWECDVGEVGDEGDEGRLVD